MSANRSPIQSTNENHSGSGWSSALAGKEAGFSAVFMIPDDLAWGLYLLCPVTDAGESTTADLTIVYSTNLTNDMSRAASTAQHTLDRSKPPVLIGPVNMAR